MIFIEDIFEPRSNVNWVSNMAGMLVASILAIIVVAFTHLIVKIIKVKYTFWGFPESIYDKHWLLGHLPHVSVFHGDSH